MKNSNIIELQMFFNKYPQLEFLQANILAVLEKVMQFNSYNKILLCGNGGSSADSDHIVGELMKEFKRKRDVDKEFYDNFSKSFNQDIELLQKLQGAIPAINLSAHNALCTAIINDIGEDFIFAQQVYAYCNKGDILFALSTSGNSKSVINAAKVCKAHGGIVVAMTGKTGGALKDSCDILLNVPERETYLAQELHLPLYHLICALIENEYFDEE